MKEREEGTGGDDDAYKFYPHILFIQSLSSMHMQCVQTADFHVSKSTHACVACVAVVFPKSAGRIVFWHSEPSLLKC